MVRIWAWGVRNPLLVVLAVAVAAGAASVVPWGLALTTAFFAAAGASLANRLVRRGAARRRRAEETRRVLDEATQLRERAKHKASRRAA